MPSLPFRFAISASFTSEPIVPVIEFWGRRLESEFEIQFAPYNQPLQTLLDPHSVFAANHHGLNVLLARLEDLGPGDSLQSHVGELIDVLRDSAPRFSVPLVVCLCPSARELSRTEHALRSRLAESLSDVPGTQYLDADEVARLYPVESAHDPEAERLGRIPYSELYFCALGTALVRRAHALFTPPYKVIALDCDNTLWQGICGEDGPSGVLLDPPRRALQEFMLDQREAGVLLAMNSKNNERDVLETFAANPQMPLALRHFAGWRLNWESKSENLASLADELGLGVDSIILVDDNPKECAEVAGSLPEVLCLTLPAEIDRTPEFLRHVWAFDRPVVTEEDRNRNAYYEQAQEFGREIRRASDLREFVAGLRLRVVISPLAEERLGRAAQLTQRTNQFNFTTIRRTESDLRALAANGFECVTVEASDRFGDYGTVGVAVFKAVERELEIDTFLLSCRVLGRGVEHRVLAWLGEEAIRRGLETVVARLEPTAKNAPAQQFLRSVGGGSNRLDARALCGLEWTPATSAPVAKPSPVPRIQRRSVDYGAIATELAAPVQILEAMRRESRAVAGSNGREGMTTIERQLADIWGDLLKCPAIAVSDNFFDLGGHSLLAVLLILRVRETFGVELSIDDVYSSTLTLGELARKVEAYQSGQMNSDEYEALLAEIEGLSDEEVQALLAREDPGVTPS